MRCILIVSVWSTHHVSIIASDNQNLRGELPSEVWALTTLRGIDFNFNEELKGQIAPEICNFSNLQRFTIGFAEFSGEIPACLNTLSNLRILFVSKPPENGSSVDYTFSSHRGFMVKLHNTN